MDICFFSWNEISYDVIFLINELRCTHIIDYESEYINDSDCVKKITVNDLHDNCELPLIVICHRDIDYIHGLLKKKGLVWGKDFIDAYQVSMLGYGDKSTDELLRKVLYSERKYLHVNCRVPYNMISVSEKGIHTCCGGRLPVYFSDTFENYDKILSSIKRKIVILSVRNGTYAFCSKSKCPLLCKEDIYIQRSKEKIYYTNEVYKNYNKPSILQIEYDAACNLSCSSCRKRYITSSKTKCENITNYILSQIVATVKQIRCAGYGEALFSEYYRRILESDETKGKELYLLTNGTLLTVDRLNQLISHFQSVSVDVSIDAADADTYEKIRGASFSMLCHNINLLSAYRKNNKIRELVINYTVSKFNVFSLCNLKSFVYDKNIDLVRISAVHNWGTWSKEEFDEIGIISDGRLKKELVPYFDTLKEIKDIVLDNNIGFENEW